MTTVIIYHTVKLSSMTTVIAYHAVKQSPMTSDYLPYNDPITYDYNYCLPYI